MAYFKLAPLDILYSQDSISREFQGGSLIGELLDVLVAGSVRVKDIPVITVKKRGRKFFSYNNRRLWVFQQYQTLGKCDAITVKMATRGPCHAFTSKNGGKKIRIRGGDPGGQCYFKLINTDRYREDDEYDGCEDDEFDGSDDDEVDNTVYRSPRTVSKPGTYAWVTNPNVRNNATNLYVPPQEKLASSSSPSFGLMMSMSAQPSSTTQRPETPCSASGTRSAISQSTISQGAISQGTISYSPVFQGYTNERQSPTNMYFMDNTNKKEKRPSTGFFGGLIQGVIDFFKICR